MILTRKLLSLACSLVLAAGFLTAIPGGVPDANAADCSTYPYFTLFEGQNGTGAHYRICYNSQPDNFTDDLPSPGVGHCGIFATTWNDCAQSVTFNKGNSSQYVCLWTNANYGGSGLRFLSSVTHYNLTGVWFKTTSSLNWGQDCFTVKP